MVIALLLLLLTASCWYVLYRTPFGYARSVGENRKRRTPRRECLAHSLFRRVLIAGALAGIGGAYLSIGQSSLFTRK